MITASLFIFILFAVGPIVLISNIPQEIKGFVINYAVLIDALFFILILLANPSVVVLLQKVIVGISFVSTCFIWSFFTERKKLQFDKLKVFQTLKILALSSISVVIFALFINAALALIITGFIAWCLIPKNLVTIQVIPKRKFLL